MAKPPDEIEADFEVVSGPLRQGDEHPRRKGWRFTGAYADDGAPLFYNRLLDLRFWGRQVSRAGWGCVAVVAGLVVLACVAVVAMNGFHLDPVSSAAPSPR